MFLALLGLVAFKLHGSIVTGVVELGCRVLDLSIGYVALTLGFVGHLCGVCDCYRLLLSEIDLEAAGVCVVVSCRRVNQKAGTASVYKNSWRGALM